MRFRDDPNECPERGAKQTKWDTLGGRPFAPWESEPQSRVSFSEEKNTVFENVALQPPFVQVVCDCLLFELVQRKDGRFNSALTLASVLLQARSRETNLEGVAQYKQVVARAK